MRTRRLLAILVTAAASAFAQQPNATGASFTVDAVDGPPFPITTTLEVGTVASGLVSGGPNVPFALAQSATGMLQPGAGKLYGDWVDIPLAPFPVIVLDGFSPGSPYLTNAAGYASVSVPVAGTPGATVAYQVYMADATSIFGFSLTAATGATLVQSATVTPLSLGDEGTALIDTAPTTIPFYGNPHTSLYVNANGYVTFGMPYSDFTPSPSEFGFGPPRIAGFWCDLDASLAPAGSITVTSSLAPSPGNPGFVRVDYAGILSWSTNLAHTFAIEIYTNGLAQIIHPPGNPASIFDMLVGIGPGLNLGSTAQKNFVGPVLGGAGAALGPGILNNGGTYLGGVNESFFEWFGLVLLNPYYTNGYDDPYDLAGQTLTFLPTGPGALPGSTDRYLLF